LAESGAPLDVALGHGGSGAATEQGLDAAALLPAGRERTQRQLELQRSNPIGENSRSTQLWKDVPRGTSSHVCLNLPFMASGGIKQLALAGRGRALNFARQLPNALSGMPCASQYCR